MYGTAFQKITGELTVNFLSELNADVKHVLIYEDSRSLNMSAKSQ